MNQLTLLLIKPSELTISNNNGSVTISTFICQIESYISSSFIVEMYVSVLTIIFVNQNDSTNPKNSHYYFCQSIEIRYEINSLIKKMEILQSLPDSASEVVNTRTNQMIDMQTDTVYCIAANGCLDDLHIAKINSKLIFTVGVVHDSSFVANSINDFIDSALYSAGIWYFYSITKHRLMMQLQHSVYILLQHVL